MVEAHNRRVSKGGSTIANAFEQIQRSRLPQHPKQNKEPSNKKRIRQSEKPLLNKIETEFLGELKKLFPGHPIKAQSVRLRLGNSVTFTPDFLVFHPNRSPTAWEVKGPFAREDAIVKLKVAAFEYPEIGFFLVWKKDGEWRKQKILT